MPCIQVVCSVCIYGGAHCAFEWSRDQGAVPDVDVIYVPPPAELWRSFVPLSSMWCEAVKFEVLHGLVGGLGVHGSAAADHHAVCLGLTGTTGQIGDSDQGSAPLRQDTLCSSAAGYSAKWDATLSVTSPAALRQNILQNTSAEYYAGRKMRQMWRVI